MTKRLLPLVGVLIGLTGLALPFVAARAVAKDDAAAEYAIDDYDLNWNVMKSDDFSMTITKTQDTTKIHLDNRLERLTMEPKDAEAVGAALKKTDAEYAALKGSDTDKSDEVDAGTYKVTFYWTVKYGFYISVRSGERFAMDHVQIERKQANEASKYLVQATKMAAYLDAKVKL